ncbi:MAG: hypothetical protein ACYDDW_03330, partial [Dermatophilaceae bacterium]
MLGWVVGFGAGVVGVADEVPVPVPVPVVLVPVVAVVPVVAEYVTVGVPLVTDEGAVLVAVGGVVRPAFGACGEDPQAA